MNMKSLFLAVSCSLLLLGCSSTNKIGEVGGIEFYSVHSAHFDGPNITALVTRNSRDNEVKIVQVFGSDGIGKSIIAAGGNVGAAAVLGMSFPDNVGDNTSTTVTGGNSSSSSKSVANPTSNSSANSTVNSPPPVVRGWRWW